MMRLVLSLGALALLSACGIEGDLARPDPLWSREEAIRRECARQAENNERQDPRCAEQQTSVPPSR
jgi:hypothetical protein